MSEQLPDSVVPLHPEDNGEINLSNPDYYINRHLSLMQFNLRVLEQALNEEYPLLERLMFLLIFSSNMDEFFEIRLAGLQRQINYSRESVALDGIHPQEVLKQLSQQCHEGFDKQYRILNEVLMPALEEENIRFLKRCEWNEGVAAWVKDYFHTQIQPVVSPLGLDPVHPFPRLANKSLNFIVSLQGTDAFGREMNRAIVPAPRSLPRLIKVPSELCDGGDNFVYLSSMMHAHIGELFPGMSPTGCYQFRLTRDADLDLNTTEVEDIARALRGELHSRRFGSAVRLEVTDDCPQELVDFLLDQVNLTEHQLYRVHGPVNLGRMMQLIKEVDRPDLKHPPLSAALPKALLNEETPIFDAVRKDDVLLLHPFQSFSPIIDLLRESARDPDVLAIKQTLYRTGATSEIVDALVEAARNGKEVTVVIELRARFDEAENLQLASRLQDAGAVITYGVVNYKTHAKTLLIVRREGNKLRRYVHLGTGNYHAGNARLYTDYSLLSCDEELGSDVHKIFQQLTGMGKAEGLKRLLSAPFSLHKKITRMIRAEASAAQEGKPARIIMKVNSLTEGNIIQELYKASQAGVTIDLVVRGMCCLRPGVPGLSENIRVVSIIGRFLEHTRTYYFENAAPQLFCGSADMMERNLKHRVEIAFPVENKKLRKRIVEELNCYLNDNTHSWELQANGEYRQLQPAEGEDARSAQLELLEKFSG
ncbi:polyphosphate kinase 1 [Porticoccus sp. W117]|uniref:polyphosphate kinase 1 n=1 Tax=Porticoccus sp. W117 TaxID=3054777 RepID=UPI002593C016|nr:polyphosphate kinase 1 [Porticoccus sp. W117]MDM3872308.1 polyphosphate kinase 1 [Porticoccus sp. W117]